MSGPESDDHGPGGIPWWSSRQPEPQPPGLTTLVSGVQAAWAWATEQVLAPHAEHADPGAHPECLACRAQVAIARLVTAVAEPAAEPVSHPDQAAAQAQIEWIELDPPRP